MTEQYPFFRDEDERTQAVIGEDAAASDLDGTYQKPYAILTQKRLYCKNEAGNFITEAKALRSAQKAHLPGQNWFLWGAAACVLVAAVCAILFSWVWGSYTYERISNAQRVMENYDSQVASYQAEMEKYEAAGSKIEENQKSLDAMNYDQLMQDISAAKSEVEARKQKVTEYQQRIAAAENSIAELEDAIAYTEDQQERLLTLANMYQEECNRYRLTDNPDVYINGIRHQYQDIESEIKKFRKMASSYGDNIAELQQQLEAAQEDFQKAGYEAQLTQLNNEVLEAENIQHSYDSKQEEANGYLQAISKNEQVQASINIEELQGEIEALQGQKGIYTTAQRTLKKISLMKPCSIALAVALILLAAFTALQRTKLAVILSWVSAGLSLAFLWCSDVFGKAYDWNNKVVSVWERYLYGSDKMVILAILVCAFLCVVLSLLALVLYRRRTVYQITHATGAFHFTPSLYPEEEFENFTARVENLNPEEEAHV